VRFYVGNYVGQTRNRAFRVSLIAGEFRDQGAVVQHGAPLLIRTAFFKAPTVDEKCVNSTDLVFRLGIRRTDACLTRTSGVRTEYSLRTSCFTACLALSCSNFSVSDPHSHLPLVHRFPSHSCRLRRVDALCADCRPWNSSLLMLAFKRIASSAHNCQAKAFSRWRGSMNFALFATGLVRSCSMQCVVHDMLVGMLGSCAVQKFLEPCLGGAFWASADSCCSLCNTRVSEK
jgi:hypothetical protein